jgi:glutathione S-transferase
MKLYYMPGACSLATHILLREAGQDVALDRVGRDKTTESGANFMQVNPKGYVPALELLDGYVLTENVAIHGHIADTFPAAKLAPAHGTVDRLKLDEMAIYITTELHKSYGPLFTPEISDEMKALYKDKLAKRYALIEKTLSDGRPYLMGDQFQTVDSYLFTVTNWAKPTGFDLSGFPNILAYMQRVAARPAVQAALVAEGLVKAA